MKKGNKITRPLFWVASLLMLSGFIATYAEVQDIKLLEFDFVATTVGVLLGFGLTIYTFVIQLIQPVVDNIEKKITSEDRKKIIKNNILSSAKELREDLWLIFVGLIVVLIIGILSKSVNLEFHVWGKCLCRIPEFIYISVYILSFRSMYDLMKALFTMGDIATELLNLK